MPGDLLVTSHHHRKWPHARDGIPNTMPPTSDQFRLTGQRSRRYCGTTSRVQTGQTTCQTPWIVLCQLVSTAPRSKTVVAPVCPAADTSHRGRGSPEHSPAEPHQTIPPLPEQHRTNWKPFNLTPTQRWLGLVSALWVGADRGLCGSRVRGMLMLDATQPCRPPRELRRVRLGWWVQRPRLRVCANDPLGRAVPPGAGWPDGAAPALGSALCPEWEVREE